MESMLVLQDESLDNLTEDVVLAILHFVSMGTTTFFRGSILNLARANFPFHFFCTQ